jgi:2-keto-3-deoxy-L-rhamnonate aldolase RhmA
MNVYPNVTKRRLAEGKVAIGFGVQQSRLVDIAAIAQTCGFDWLFLDMEHSALDLGIASQIATAALPLGITPIVRVPGKEHHHATRMLDCGTQGVVVPHVDSADDARRVVDYCRYPPFGHRSLYGIQPQFSFKSLAGDEAMRLANEETLVVAMVESPDAVAHADEIAAVPGIDVVLIGTNDFCAEAGIAGQYGHDIVKAAYRTVIDACRRHGKHPGMGGVVDHPLLEEYIGMGMRFILAGNDIAFLMNAARQRAAFIHGLGV